MRSGLVASAEEYPWSSAGSHVSGLSDPLLSGHCFLTETIADWHGYLAEAGDPAEQNDVVRATKRGRPCGSEDFLRQMEALAGKRFIPLPAVRRRRRPVQDQDELPLK